MTDAADGNPAERSCGGLRVLVADDVEVNRLVATRVLGQIGCRVVTVPDGARVLDAIDEDEYDVVVLDVHMPVMGGLEAAALIRLRERLRGSARRLPVFALTAGPTEDLRGGDAMNPGWTGVLSKPITAESFAAVATLVPPLAVEPDVPAIRRERLEALCGGDPEFLAELAAAFATGLSRGFRDVAAALAAPDGSRLATAAHAMKGICLTLEALTRLPRPRAEVEMFARAADLPSARTRLGLARVEWAALRSELDGLVPGLDWAEPFPA